MHRTHPLSEFMPYGAPELLAAARPHLARALALSSLLPILVFFAALPLTLLRTTAPAPVVVPQVWIDPTVVLPPPLIELPPEATPASPARSSATDGIVTPVPEAAAPPDAEFSPGAVSDPNGVPGTGAGPGPLDIAPPAAAPPIPDTPGYIYRDEEPVPVVQPKPDYPELAREAGVEGLIVVDVFVGVTGRVERARLNEKFSQPLLNAAALEAARRWTFLPARANGHPVGVWITIPFRFTLHR